MHLLIMDRDPARRAALAGQIQDHLPDRSVRVTGAAQQSVFGQRWGARYAAAFLWIEGMPDLEAARQLTRVLPGLPLVLVSDSGEYAMEGYHLHARYYLHYPASRHTLVEALRRCGILDIHHTIKQEEIT